MKRRLAWWKECRRTSAGGQPRAAPLSHPEGPLAPPSLPSRHKREYPVSLPGRLCLSRSLSLPLAHRARSSHRRRRRSIALRPLLATYRRMSESTRLWWFLIPPGASLVTHAARGSPVPPDPLVVPLIRVYPCVRPMLPLPPIGISFPPPPFRLFLFLPLLPPSRNATRHASGDTRGPTQVMHGPSYIFDPLFGLFFPTGSNVRCLSCPRRLLRLLPPSAPSLFLLALSRVGKITIVPVPLSCSRALSVSPSFSPFFISTMCNTPWLRANILGAHQ